MTTSHQLRLSRQSDGIFLNSNGREIFFSHSDWSELREMILAFETTKVREIMNYTPLPTRTPLHANTPAKPTLEDLI